MRTGTRGWCALLALVAALAGGRATGQDCEPVLLGTHDLGQNYAKLLIDGDVLYLASVDLHVVAFDISDPLEPVEIGRVASRFGANDLVLHGDLLLVASAGTGGGVTIYDVSDPAAMRQVSDVSMVEGAPISPIGVDVHEDRMYVAGMLDGLLVFDIADPSDPAYLGSFEFVFEAYDVQVGSFMIGPDERILAFMAYEFGDFGVVDITDPTAGVMVSRQETGIRTFQVLLDDDRVFVHGTGYGLSTFTLDDPRRPTRRSRVEPPRQAHQMALSQDIMVVSADSDGFTIVDVEDAGCTRAIYDTGRVPGGRRAGIASRRTNAGGHFMYVVARDGAVEVWDIASCRPGPCVADFTGDCQTTGSDFVAFEIAFSRGEARADLDGDGRHTVMDYLAFINAYLEGC
ncbi:MAG: GC-type dockerin domain-anchored protein [Phycisphaerales bacterium]